MNPSITAIVLVKGQSQRCTGKNFREIGGLPLWALSIRGAINSDSVDNVLVITDSNSHERVSDYIIDKNVPKVTALRRPDYLENADTTSEQVLLWLAEKYLKNNYIMLLQATCPVITVDEINWIYHFIDRIRPEALVSVNPHTMKEDGNLYISTCGALRDFKTFYHELLHVTALRNHDPKWYTKPYIDIDREEDFYIAKALIEGRTI